MKQIYINKLRQSLQLHFNWNKSRMNFLTFFVPTIIMLATIKLSRIALFMKSDVKSESNYKTLQRFFKNFSMDYEEYSRFVFTLLSSSEQYYLVNFFYQSSSNDEVPCDVYSFYCRRLKFYWSHSWKKYQRNLSALRYYNFDKLSIKTSNPL